MRFAAKCKALCLKMHVGYDVFAHGSGVFSLKMKKIQPKTWPFRKKVVILHPQFVAPVPEVCINV